MPDLPNDIIFQLIQEDLSSRSLDTLRRLSQISRTWRALALSPILWAKALDFEELRLKKDIWRTEVLRRTGNCALHVNGSWIPSVTQEFFLHEFLVPNLHRIKTLHAHIGLMNNKVAQDPAWSVIFDQPAPMLEIFGLDFNARHKQDPPRAIQHALRDGKALFAANAPVLHTFNNNPYLALSHSTQPAPDWMINLTTIMVSEPPKTVLGILTQTPRLRRLFLMELTVWEEIEGLPGVSSVDLPCLEYIYKDHTYPDGYFVEIQQAIKAPQGMSVFAGFRTPRYIDAAAMLFRKYIDETQPKGLHFRLPIFWLGNFPLTSRKADVDEMFLKSTRKDFAILIGGPVHPSDFLARVVADGVDFSSVQEWHIRRCGESSIGGCSREMVAALKEFFAKVLKPDDVLTVDKNNYEYFERDEVLPKGHIVKIVKNGASDNDRQAWGV